MKSKSMNFVSVFIAYILSVRIISAFLALNNSSLLGGRGIATKSSSACTNSGLFSNTSVLILAGNVSLSFC